MNFRTTVHDLNDVNEIPWLRLTKLTHKTLNRTAFYLMSEREKTFAPMMYNGADNFTPTRYKFMKESMKGRNLANCPIVG